MIIDGHAHAFPFLGGTNGHKSVEDHMRALHHHALQSSTPTFETKTRRVVTEDTLSDGRYAGYSSLLDVDFRIGKFGRMEWTKDGVDYHMQWMPPLLQDNVAPIEWLIAEMDYVGIDRLMMHNAHVYGLLNDYFAECVAKFPDRIGASAQIREADCDKDSEIRELRRAVKELGLTALHFQNEGFFHYDFQDNLDDEKFTPFWEEVARLGIPVLWNIRPTKGPQRPSYIEQTRRFGVWARRWPQIPSVYTHGVHLRWLLDERGHVEIPDEMWWALEADNVFLELLLPITQGGRWDYPFPEAQELIKRFYERLGGSKMHWGSDLPCTQRLVTYRQTIDYIRRYCHFIKPDDMDRILGGNAAALFRFK
jgi:predicted TIM-barrel fold metal-dependent hydrolase